MLRAAFGALVGFGCGLAAPAPSHPPLARAAAPAASPGMAASDEPPIFVVVGGGFTGSKLAQSLDALCRVVLIDEKNYLESIEYAVPVLCKPWDDDSTKALADAQVVHRNYLQHGHVVVGSVVDVDLEGKKVLLRDGRRIAYDAMAFCLGERRAFPLQTRHATTLLQRETELKEFSRFVERDCHRIAVVGGGPMGVCIASLLGSNYPFKTIDLFHRGEELLTTLPEPAGSLAHNKLLQLRNVEVHTLSHVTDVKRNDKRGWFGRKLKPSFDVFYEIHEPVRVEPPSVLHQLYFGEAESQNKAKKASEAPRTVKETSERLGYDFVFVCSGNVPAAREFAGAPSLAPHLDKDGRFRVSRFMQLLGRPEVFAVGRCNGFPGYVRGLRTSDYQTNLFMRNFRNFMTAAFDRHGVANFPSSFTINPLRGDVVGPHVKFPMGGGVGLAVDSITGPSCGPEAMASWDYELKERFMRHAHTPKLQVPADGKKMNTAMRAWLSMAVTDVADFVWA